MTKICLRQGVSNGNKLGYLTAFIKLISDDKTGDYGFTRDEIFACLRIGLIQEATQVRAAALRVVRYLLKEQQDIIAMNKLNYPYFIARSMDVLLRNDMERMQALRLLRRILLIAPKHLSPILARSLICLTNSGVEEKTDRSFRVFLATLCELGVLNSSLLIDCGGVGCLARSAMCGIPASMVESVVGVLIQLLTNPETRNSVSLLSLAAPYCELNTSTADRFRLDRERSFAASKQALLTVLRSYSGFLSFCNPHNNSGLKAISDILYVEQLEVRGAVLELLYELLGLPLPVWTDEPDVALAAVDPSRPRDNWRLSEGFVAAEGKSILPIIISHCPNLTELHLALLVYVLLECGLHRALAETIVTSDTFISVRAAVLLGGLLHLAHSLLPSDVCDVSPALPNLLEHASVGHHQALAAITILERMHVMMKRKPSPSSLFLDRILQAGSWLRSSPPRRHVSSSRVNWLRRESATAPLLRDSQVLDTDDGWAWDWTAIRSILRSRDDTLRVLGDSDHRTFIKKLVDYFKPSTNKYRSIELGGHTVSGRECHETTLAGCDLINCLLELHEPEGTRYLNELIGDISMQIIEITKDESSAHDATFSPRNMKTTCCQNYFLFIGQLSHSAKGTVILKSFNLLNQLENLALITHQDCYVKLIVSSLDYTRDGPNRKILDKIISCPFEQKRLYATQFLRIILRAKMTDAYQWALARITDRLTDNSKTVALAALDMLHEACEDTEYLETIFQQIFNDNNKNNNQWSTWLEDQLGFRAHLFKIKFYSLGSGFKKLPSPTEELDKWLKKNGFAERYVGFIEGEINDSFTRRQRGENGSYLRRQSSMLILPKDVFVLPHIFGQFVQHEHGLQLLRRKNIIPSMKEIIQSFMMDFGGGDNHCNNDLKFKSKINNDDSYVMSEESGNEEITTTESNRLETIIDSEIMETNKLTTSINHSPCTMSEKSFWKDEEATVGIKTIEVRILHVKAALWSLGHVGTSAAGVDMLNHHGIIYLMTNIAETCEHYSVRATAMYAMSLISTTKNGADALTIYDWPCVRYKRGDYWPVIVPTNPYPVSSSCLPIQKHHRSLSDGKPDLPEPSARRARNRSESAATDYETKLFPFISERGSQTPSPLSSVQRFSQENAEGYAKLRSLQRHRRPSFTQSNSDMYSYDGGRNSSLQSLVEFESSKFWIVDSYYFTATLPTVPTNEEEENIIDSRYLGICLPKKLDSIFPHTIKTINNTLDNNFDGKLCKNADANFHNDDNCLEDEDDVRKKHWEICLICNDKKSYWDEQNCDKSEAKIRR